LTRPTHVHPSDLRGFSRLAIDATEGLTDLVEAMHHNIASVPGPLGAPAQGSTGGITGLVYQSIRGVTRLVGGGIDALLGQLVPLFGVKASSPEREAMLAALNGVMGDYLVASANPLAIAMHLRRDGHGLDLTREALAAAIAQPGGKLLILAHGLCMNDLQWLRQGHDHGAALARDLGWTPLYLHYNSGLHVSVNGHAFAAALEDLVKAWQAPVKELVIIGHSMGGLVARSACHYGRIEGHRWLKPLRKIIFLGTPHHGAPLERGGNWVDMVLAISPYTAPFTRLGKIRSAGITDLRHGSLRDEDWEGRDRFAHARDARTPLPLPDGVACYAIAASTTKEDSAGGRLAGDGIVPVASALGRHKKAAMTLQFPESQQWVARGMNHFDLLSHIAVYDKIRQWLA
jgi:pimeloyl-ACP methyl ester carboxylesterase